jgi:XTP/dITP diphosphohydrolase
MEIVIATRNRGKIREIREALDVGGVTLRTFEEFEDWPETEETGATLEDNALIKAFALRDGFGLASLADDSGLLVDRLGGHPGVHSSRYAGPEGDAERNMDRLLAELEGVPGSGRSARFACVLALALPGGDVHVTRGECEGNILTERRGAGGFGYDPVFMPAGFDRSMAELSVEDKNAISHRGKALRAMKDVITDLNLGSDLFF